MGANPSVSFLRPSRLPKRRQQVAAVCYRVGKRGIEFLLVQTRSGRWIFPKGGVEPGLTYAQSAALEAFEEAGVHGRIEAVPFARYFRRPRSIATAKQRERASAAQLALPELAVAAHLCEVSHLEPPQESNRRPTWFSAEKAKQRLVQDRAPEFGAELVRVVDRAAARIRRLQAGSAHPLIHAQPGQSKLVHARKDALQEVPFDAFEVARRRGVSWSAAYARYIGRAYLGPRSSASPPLGSNRPTLRLGNGTVSGALQKVQFIDAVRPANGARSRAKSARSRQD